MAQAAFDASRVFHFCEDKLEELAEKAKKDCEEAKQELIERRTRQKKKWYGFLITVPDEDWFEKEWGEEAWKNWIPYSSRHLTRMAILCSRSNSTIVYLSEKDCFWLVKYGFEAGCKTIDAIGWIASQDDEQD